MAYLRDAALFIAVVGDRRLIRTYPELYNRNNIYQYQQSVAACMQNMWLAATAQGLGGTWLSMGRLIEKPIEELLDVPAPDYRVEFILAVGWPDHVREERERSSRILSSGLLADTRACSAPRSASAPAYQARSPCTHFAIGQAEASVLGSCLLVRLPCNGVSVGTKRPRGRVRNKPVAHRIPGGMPCLAIPSRRSSAQAHVCSSSCCS